MKRYNEDSVELSGNSRIDCSCIVSTGSQIFEVLLDIFADSIQRIHSRCCQFREKEKGLNYGSLWKTGHVAFYIIFIFAQKCALILG